MKRPKKIRQISRADLSPGESLCEHCTAKCCRYFALPIDRPRTFNDLEYIRWFLLHERASIFIEDNTWFLLVHTECKHLQADHRCGIYDTRPKICREYSTDDCEFDDSYTYEKYFETAEQVTEYADARFGNDPTDPNFRTPKPVATLPIVYDSPTQV